MNINLLIGIVTLLAAIFFFAAYGITVIQTYEQNRKYLYLSIIYFIGSFFFLLYGIFVFYRAIKYAHIMSGYLIL
jgi:O-antigen/teichoic acid export membrane protein